MKRPAPESPFRLATASRLAYAFFPLQEGGHHVPQTEAFRPCHGAIDISVMRGKPHGRRAARAKGGCSLSGPLSAHFPACGRSGLTHDARGEGPPDAAHGPGHPPAPRSLLRLVERGPARRGALRLRHSISAGRRHGRHLGFRSHPSGRPGHFHRSPGQIQPGAAPG